MSTRLSYPVQDALSPAGLAGAFAGVEWYRKGLLQPPPMGCHGCGTTMPARDADTIRAAFAQHHTVKGAARALHVAPRTLFRWLRADPSLVVAGVDRAGPGRARAQDPPGSNGSKKTPPNKAEGVKLTPRERRAVAARALARGASAAGAAREAGVDERTVRRWITAGLQ